MRAYRCLAVGFALLIIGCSPLQTDVRSSFDWQGVSGIRLETPEPDPWNLAPLVRQELRRAGYEVLSNSGEKVDLVARFAVEEALDINEVGEIISRPKELQIRFFEPVDMTKIAEASYRLSATERPEHGIRKLFGELGKDSAKEPEVDKLAEPSEPRMPVSPERQKVKTGVAEEKAEPDETDEQNSRSPWMPRLESWGFEEWGKSENENEW